jgi:dTDP-4-amino-4,6-dideoxygalactose transaminase
MALTNSEQLAKKMSLLRSHGVTRDPEQMSSLEKNPWYYEQIDLGFNYRMTDIQAALGISQMQRLDYYVARRQLLARRYDELLEGLPLVRPVQNRDAYSAMHLYVIRLQLEKIDILRSQVFQQLRDKGIGVNVHYIPVHTQPYYKHRGFKIGDFPESECFYDESISLPLYPTMREEQQDQVVNALADILTE